MGTKTRTSRFRACFLVSATSIFHLTSDRLSELLELRRLRKARQGIDVHKLSSGDIKKKRRRNAEEAAEEQGGLRPGAGSSSGAGAAAGAGPGAKTEDE